MGGGPLCLSPQQSLEGENSGSTLWLGNRRVCFSADDQKGDAEVCNYCNKRQKELCQPLFFRGRRRCLEKVGKRGGKPLKLNATPDRGQSDVDALFTPNGYGWTQSVFKGPPSL